MADNNIVVIDGIWQKLTDAQFEEKFGKNLKAIKDTVNNQLKDIRDDNTKQLDKIRNTVDE